MLERSSTEWPRPVTHEQEANSEPKRRGPSMNWFHQPKVLVWENKRTLQRQMTSKTRGPKTLVKIKGIGESGQ